MPWWRGANCGLAQVIFALDRIGLRAGETLVVQGAGGLGLYASAVGRELGARVVVVEREPDRLRLAVPVRGARADRHG